MGDAKRKAKREERFFQENPICCFCGGITPSDTRDHIPPQACFPKGHFPEDFEFPACKSCNGSTRENDHIFSLYANLLDFDDANRDWETIDKLLKGISNNCPDALPSLIPSANSKQRAPGKALKDMPVVGAPSIVGDAIDVINRKLACALNYRERGRIVSSTHKITIGWNQLQNGHFEPLTRYLAELLPNQTIGTRTNIKNYGRRFGYKSGIKEEDDFFIYAAQFGLGLILWGMVTAPNMKRPFGIFDTMTHTVFTPPT